ncbi:MAG: glutamate synthase subunit beta [Verrucomicrobiae bacterium]|nr:glutamate synthase subunit beta [Verrucomicrobiae bacterium]
MGKLTGFMEYERETATYRPVEERIRDYKEIPVRFPDEKLQTQGARCMDCGVPFCHTGCPLGNVIPDWNDLVYRGKWKEAIDRLHFTNNFPEFTGRICPAPCEKACVLGIIEPPVSIKQIEVGIVEHAFEEGWIVPHPPAERTGKTVAVIGSGPAGLAAADQLNKAGHTVTVFERSDRIGGLLMYGIPHFKLDKEIVKRRLNVMEAEGVQFKPSTWVGKNYPTEKLKEFDAVVIAVGATKGRELPIPGRDLDGIHLAMDFLPQQNKRLEGDDIPEEISITAKGKHVIVIGGGDTGSDCIGTSNRQGALSVTQIEIMPAPPEKENKPLVWPLWPMKMRTSSSQEEGVVRDFAVATIRFEGENGVVKKLICARADDKFQPIPGTEFELKADLVTLAMGFLGPVQEGMVKDLGIELDKRGNVFADTFQYKTSREKVFSCGDMRRGQSLVVWAIREGRQCARSIDQFLMGRTTLPR